MKQKTQLCGIRTVYDQSGAVNFTPDYGIRSQTRSWSRETRLIGDQYTLSQRFDGELVSWILTIPK